MLIKNENLITDQLLKVIGNNIFTGSLKNQVSEIDSVYEVFYVNAFLESGVE